jgi:hypothetical protein
MTPKRYLLSILALVLLTFAPASHALAADQPNILIMGDDADEDTVPRHSRIFNRVVDTLQDRMMEEGFSVYNETAVTMDVTDTNRVRRTDAELITVAKAIKTPIDVIVTFQIYASAQDNKYSDIQQLLIRVVGRMVQVNTGKQLGNFEVSMGPEGLNPLPVACNRDCVIENVGDEAKIVANEVGLVLAEKLDALSPIMGAKLRLDVEDDEDAVVAANDECSGLPSAYSIILKQFDPEMTRRMEDILVSLPGYSTHRPIRSETRYQEIWYETCADVARLKRNIEAMADMMPGKHRVTLAGNTFEVENLPGSGSRK